MPNNIVTAMSTNDILAVMFFALIFGIGLLLTQTPQTAVLKSVIEGMFEVSMRLIGLIIRLAPIAIVCFMFNLAALFGWDLLVKLGAYVGVVLLALGIQMFVVLPAAAEVRGRRLAALVLPPDPGGDGDGLLDRLVQRHAADRAARRRGASSACRARIARFVLTIGATANQNGTAMFEGVTVLFLAQFFGVDLSLGQQAVVMFVCILGGIGTAGVPAGRCR